MKILFGTTNPAKLEKMKEILSSLDMELLSLNHFNSVIDVEEDGKTPLENALKKVRAYHSVFGVSTFSIDSGLFIDEFSEDKQPGVHVRRVGGRRLNDEELLQYYIDELKKVGGESAGRWETSVAYIDENGKEHHITIEDPTYFVSEPSKIIKEGEPLGSIQYSKFLDKYKSEITPEEWQSQKGDMAKELYEFFKRFFKNKSKNKIIEIDKGLRLVEASEDRWSEALPWYTNEKVLLFSEGIEDGRVYDMSIIEKMYSSLSSIGELYFIEAFQENKWVSIGDAALSEQNMPIVLGDEKFWGLGIGKKVIKALLCRAREKGLKKITVEIYDFNKRSQNLFKGFGFKKTREEGDCGFYELIISK